MKIQYSINIENKIITETWPEEVSIEDYKAVKKAEFNDPLFETKFNVITDLRLLNLGLDEDVIDKIIGFIKDNSNHMKDRKSAIITNSPQQVVNSYVFSSKAQGLPINFKVFSTFEAAYKWFLEDKKY